MVNDVDFDKLIEFSDELVDYENVLPLLIRAIIMKRWTRNLNNKGLYRKVMTECSLSKPHNYDEAVKELVDWCKQNKKYNDIIIK